MKPRDSAPCGAPILLCLVCAAGLASVAAGAAWAQAPPPPAPAAARPPDVLLITVDTLRPDTLGWIAGNGATPSLDALAREGFRFPAAVAPTPVTQPSHASLFTGLIPRRHGVRANGQVLGSALTTLAERLAEKGYETAAFVSGYPLVAQYGLDQGFDRYDDDLTTGTGGRLERPAAETVTAALVWAAKAPSPWFLWIHFYDPHDPYAPPDAFARPGARGAYDGEVAYVDHEIGRLRQRLTAVADRPLLTVFAADHGESLGEHGEATHGFFIYESTVAVPLVFHLPGRIAAGESRAPARLVDVAPTVLDLLGLPPLADVDGVTLKPLLAGRGGAVPPAYVESRRPWLSYGWAPLRAVREGPWKLIAAPRPELYHVERDPQESRNLAAEERATAHRLAKVLAEIEARPAAGAEVLQDPEAMERLRALGYLGGAGPGGEPPPGLADPKDRVELWNALSEAEALLERGETRAAVARFDEVLAAEPKNPFALSRSGAALLAAGDAAAAVPRLEQAAALQPGDAETVYTLAQALTVLRRFDDAVQRWLAVVELQPRRLEAWVSLGNTLGVSGRRERAVEAFARAVEVAPERPDLWIRRAFAEHGAGRPDAAIASLERAASLSGMDGFSHAGALGLLLVQRQRPGEARIWLARARPAEAEFAEARFQLARIEAQAGRQDAARRALGEALGVAPQLRGRAAEEPLLQGLLP